MGALVKTIAGTFIIIAIAFGSGDNFKRIVIPTGTGNEQVSIFCIDDVDKESI
jgi:hypothetical protein